MASDSGTEPVEVVVHMNGQNAHRRSAHGRLLTISPLTGTCTASCPGPYEYGDWGCITSPSAQRENNSRLAHASHFSQSGHWLVTTSPCWYRMKICSR